MTDQQLIIAVAKLDGWVPSRLIPPMPLGMGNAMSRHKQMWLKQDNNTEWEEYQMPRYLTSRDAIIPVIEKVINTKDEVWTFSVNLSKILTETDEDYQELSPVDYITATAQQLSIALVKSTGNWTEE